MPTDRSSDGASRVGREPGQVAAPLDETDHAIVAELRRDGRLSVRALAERVHISRATAYSRLERLHRERVITGYAAQVDADKLGLATAAYVSVSIEQGAWREVLEALEVLPRVEKVALVGAEFDMLVEVRARDNHELRDVVLGRIQAVAGVRATRTWLIFDEWER
ncbi:Lrp/AsnC family transcriptional regulator [Serinicoccus sediminis]|uniref:Lrp/AsnC family transcriptional regulator n=1 Tax=Serinicoccus sediminis TaxID=2306021 RepID=UPI001021ADD1|nr:Lrp/AsnC family transcriptional regulator [Serinicoccus sediminis]